MATIDWLMGLGIMVGMALVFTFMTFKDISTFFIWLNIFAGFVVWAGLLPLWVVVLTLIVLTLLLANSFMSRQGGMM